MSTCPGKDHARVAAYPWTVRAVRDALDENELDLAGRHALALWRATEGLRPGLQLALAAPINPIPAAAREADGKGTFPAPAGDWLLLSAAGVGKTGLPARRCWGGCGLVSSHRLWTSSNAHGPLTGGCSPCQALSALSASAHCTTAAGGRRARSPMMLTLPGGCNGPVGALCTRRMWWSGY